MEIFAIVFFDKIIHKIECDDLCASCSITPINCDECNPSAILDNSRCKCLTDNGYNLATDPITSKLTCNKCHNLCKTCHGISQFECDTCRLSTVPFLEHILPYTCECITGYFYDITKENNYCQKCDNFCKTCIGTFDNCLSCLDIDGVQMISNNKCKCNKPGFFVYFNETTHKDDCVKCHPLCDKCTGPLLTQCDICNTFRGAIYIGDRTCSCKPHHFYSILNENCEECDSRCNECFGPSWKECLNCNLQKSLLVEDHLNSWCTTDCESLIEPVKQIGYYKNGTICKCIFIKYSLKIVCFDDCKTCVGYDKCLTCLNSSLVMFNYTCQENCPEHFYNFYGACQGIFLLIANKKI